MAEVDRNLLGQGFPERVELRPIARECEAMREFVEKHVRAEIEMWRPRRWYEGWYEQNRFLVWAIGTLVAVAGLAVKFL